jgi:hypothetical protein
MPRVFLGNFDFEHELAGAAAGKPQEAELFWAWLPIADARDVLPAPSGVDERDFAALGELGLPLPRLARDLREFDSLHDFELVPWGWTRAAVDFGHSHGWNCPAPPLKVVRQVNSREFRFNLEQEWNIGLTNESIATTLAEVDAVLQQFGNASRGWLLKANFGMSGREAMRGRGTALYEKTRNWAQKRLAAVGPIIFEPIVERIAEAGIQIEVPHSGLPLLAGVTPLLVDKSGVYRGSRFGCPASELEIWQPAVETAMRVAEKVQQLGYFGPLGIDAMQYRDEAGAIRLRPLQDVNARYTMGRLALGLGRILRPGWCGTWLHFNRRHLAGRDLDAWLAEVRLSLPTGTITAVTSPRMIGSQPAYHHALIVLASSPELRRQAEAALFASFGSTVEVN